MLPVTCLGARDKGEVQITCKLMHSSAMESGPRFREWRWQVIHIVSGQGTEKNVRAAPILQGAGVSVREAIRRLEAEEVTLEEAAVREAQFPPEAIDHIGHKHIFFNALRHCIEDQPEYPFWKDALNTYLGVVCKTESRTRFVARCMRGPGPARHL